MNYSISIIDNHILFCEGLKALLNSNEKLKFDDNYYSGKDYIENINNSKSDIILIDYSLPDTDSFELIKMIKKNDKNTKVIFLTETDSSPVIMKAYDSKADGYILKSVNYETFIDGVESVLHGNRYFAPDVLPVINRELLIRDTHEELLNKLTKREKQILVRVAKGMSNIEIAIDCHISERTVKNHLSSIFQKIKVSDRTQAAVFAIKANLVQI